MNLRHRPSFAAATTGNETLMVFVLPDRLLAAVVTRDQADDIAGLADQMRELEADELLSADPANREIAIDTIFEAVSLPGVGPFEIELKLRDAKPFRLRFETRNDRDTIFEELAELLGGRVPFFRQPPSRLTQMASPLAMAILFGVLGVGSYIWFSNVEASERVPRMHVLIKWLWETLGKEGILAVFLGLAGLFLLVAVKRLLAPRPRQALGAPGADEPADD